MTLTHKLKPKLNALADNRAWPFWILLAVSVSLIYLLMARLGYGVDGFPLDDAWIHQTYARNLGQQGQFAFTPGLTSTGSTAPLWTILLSVGYVLNIPFKLWSHGWGMIFLGLSGFFMAKLGRQLFPEKSWLGPIIGLAVVLEWHLIWAAVSGMETILFICLSIGLVLAFVQLLQKPGSPSLTSLRAYFLLGVGGGLLMLTRPEGLGLVGLMGLVLGAEWWRKQGGTKAIQTILQTWVSIGVGLAVLVLPYWAFNWAVSGSLFPNTLYAKQQEYAILLNDLNFFERLFNVVSVGLVGGQALLIPGLIFALVVLWRRSKPGLWLVAAWWASHLILYAVRLPVTYQHGRYQIPTLPWLLLLGIWGTSLLIKWYSPQLLPRVLSRTWAISAGLGVVVFVLVGANGYAVDVRIIDSEMVATAQWVNANLPAETIIAAHDIGALGYFTERPLVDLAGLITPAVIPFIRDEDRLLAFSQAQGASYLVTFPSWYPKMTADLEPIYSTNSPWAVELGNDNMTVYPLP